MRKAISVYENDLEIETPDGEGRLVDVKFKVVVEYGQDERDRSYVEIADDPLTWNKEQFTPEENEAIAAQLTDRFVKSIEDRAIDKFKGKYSTHDRAGRRMVIDPDDYFEEVRRFQKIAGILKEDRFYAPTYLLQVLGSQEAVDNLIKQFEEDHASEEDPEGDNARDYLLSIDNPEELMRAIRDYIDLSEMELGLKPDQLEEDDYDMGTPSGDTDAMNIAEDDFSGTMHAVEDDPVV